MSLVAAASITAGLCVPSAVQAQNAANADQAYDGFLRAYLQTTPITVNGKQFAVPYITQTINNRDLAFFWQQAYMITGLIDAYERNYAPSRKTLIVNLLNNFQTQNLQDWSWDQWNDDDAWACIAMLRGYIITGNTSYLNQAIQNWNMIYNRGWDGTYGGGIWERMDEVPGGGKCGLSNWNMVMAGCMIYKINGDATILNKSQAIYAWGRANIFDPGSGRVWEGIYPLDPAGKIANPSTKGGDDNAYNSGLIVNAANALYQITGTAQYYNDATVAINHVIAKGSVLNSSHAPVGDFHNDQFLRALSLFARQNNQWNTYWPWLQGNCTASWNVRRTDDNITLNDFTQQTPTNGDLGSMDTIESVVVQAVSQMNPLTGVHAISNKANGLAIDNGNNTGPAPVIQWSLNGGATQKWIFTQNSDNSWNIVSWLSGLPLEDPKGSTGDGTQMDQVAANGASYQKWWVDVQSDGSYKIWNVASSKSLDNDNMSKVPSPLIQWTWTGSNNQRWLMR